ncbi:hypothetical protein RHGRI_032625 [Rhododendron griersonianum]|uniref:Uncharacterized protein n=1 Tax=Rhododendron griersonianum TaxID=479676 RepID=A0AAV6ICG9_9ERIC|nr:hypothetical protein RHGRI_032625 [Rhododendron griersonianum]
MWWWRRHGGGGGGGGDDGGVVVVVIVVAVMVAAALWWWWWRRDDDSDGSAGCGGGSGGVRGTMTKIENDKNRVRVRKQKSGSQNRKVRQRKDAMKKSLVGSISSLFNAKKQKSLLSSQVEEESDEEFGEDDVNDNLRDKDVNEEASGANTGDVHEEPMSEDVDVANEESREGHNEGPTPMNENVGNEEHESMLDLEKDVDVNYDPGL